MLSSPPFPMGPPNAAMLLVLLPEAASSQRLDPDLLPDLQRHLGSSIRVLRVEEGSHPAVVRSFQPSELPALILVQQGVELWRQTGLAVSDALPLLLLSKIRVLDNV